MLNLRGLQELDYVWQFVDLSKLFVSVIDKGRFISLVVFIKSSSTASPLRNIRTLTPQ